MESETRKELWAFQNLDLAQLREAFQVPDGVLLHSGEELEVIQDISQLQASKKALHYFIFPFRFSFLVFIFDFI